MSAKKIDFDYEKNLLYENMKDEELYRKKPQRRDLVSGTGDFGQDHRKLSNRR